MNSKLQTLLKENASYWIPQLQKPPYNLLVKEKNNLLMFKYHQIESDFSLQEVQEARGITFEKDTWNIVKHPMHKFFNHGETNAHKIDWDSVKVLEKLDGSLIIIWFYKEKVRISTNGTIDARDAELQMPYNNIRTFFDLVIYTLTQMFFNDIEKLFDDLPFNVDKNSSHMFELCTPYNRIVVPYKECKLYYINSKVNETGEEYYEKYLSKIFPMPRLYSFTSVDKCIEFTQKLPYSEEGYVVVDENWNRQKIKSPAYLAMHRLRGEGALTSKRIIQLIQTGEEGEFLTYFPEYHDIFSKYQDAWVELQDRVLNDIDYFFSKTWFNKKEFALEAKNSTIPDLMFQMYDGKIDNTDKWKEYLYNMRTENLVKKLEEMM